MPSNLMTQSGNNVPSEPCVNSPEYRTAIASLRKGKLGAAQHLSANVAVQYPGCADAYALQAAVSVAMKDFRSALRFIGKAEELAPENVSYLAHKGFAQAELLEYANALASADAAMALDPTQPEVLATIGNIYSKCGAFEKSLPCFHAAAALAPDDATHQYNLGTALRFNGDFVGAEKRFDRSIELRPTDYETYYARSGLRKQTPQRNHIAALSEMVNHDNLPWRGKSLIYFALAKEYEDLGEWEESFTCLQRGADLRRRNMRYDVTRDEVKLAEIAATFSNEVLNTHRVGFDTKEPIFIVGLPRAGSTLLDRILSSHSDVTPAGELQSFAIEMMRLIHKRLGTSELPFRRILSESLKLDLQVLGESYLRSTRHLSKRTPHFTDKMPMNFLYIGLIRLALPNARIVHVHRNPMDACYAMYRTVFKGAYPYSYDLDDLGRYYVAYYKLMKHWNTCLHGHILNVRYEDMVSDQTATTRSLLRFCGLEWQEACLTFHKLTAPVTTASAVDVRRPIYKSSVGKWTNYRAQLTNLESYLAAEGIGL